MRVDLDRRFAGLGMFVAERGGIGFNSLRCDPAIGLYAVRGALSDESAADFCRGRGPVAQDVYRALWRVALSVLRSVREGTQ